MWHPTCHSRSPRSLACGGPDRCFSKGLAFRFPPDGFNNPKRREGRADEQIALHASLGSMVAVMWRGKGPTLTAIVRAGHDKSQMKDVVKQLVGKLPKDGAALVRLTASGLIRSALFCRVTDARLKGEGQKKYPSMSMSLPLSLLSPSSFILTIIIVIAIIIRHYHHQHPSSVSISASTMTIVITR